MLQYDELFIKCSFLLQIIEVCYMFRRLENGCQVYGSAYPSKGHYRPNNLLVCISVCGFLVPRPPRLLCSVWRNYRFAYHVHTLSLPDEHPIAVDFPRKQPYLEIDVY